MSHQLEFARALLDPELPPPPGLSTCNGSDPARRFAVYRNNVLCTLTDALADTFPVVQAVVGEAFFRAMAHVFVRAHPPDSPVLAFYGANFADFIADFEPAATLPYLADLARLEMTRVQVYHAADEPPLTPDRLALLAAGCRPGTEPVVELTPSLRLLRSSHPVVSVWAAHQQDPIDLSFIDWSCAESALVTRHEFDVLVIPVDPQDFREQFNESH